MMNPDLHRMWLACAPDRNDGSGSPGVLVLVPRVGVPAPKVAACTNATWAGSRLLSSRWSDEHAHSLSGSCTTRQEDDRATRQLQLVVRNDTEADRPAADIIAFDQRTWVEDKAILEVCYPDFHLDVTANVHLKVDRGSIEYRRLLSDIATGAFPAGD